ncbi:MAG TPA: glycosyltransferase family 4 protein [Planctomycetaceae bacterium]|nr:glycosyltransferase family 4 protein [Planctomycetaceae bacterium]
MHIAQVSPLYESVPPMCYGGTERVVSYLTEELVRLGHDVTLFASGDSVTRARLAPGAPQALRLANCIDPLAHHIRMLDEVFQQADRFDLVHFHIDYLHFPLSRRAGLTHVTTLHGRLDLPDLVPLYREFDEMPLVSISDAQRSPLPWVNWQGTVHHGLPLDLYGLHEKHGGYLAFLGRISPEKRVDRAIEIARRCDLELRIAAKIDRVDREYFDEQIEPLFKLPHVTYVGEIGERAKPEFLGGARAVLFPIDWPEPFGLVMIESMACGTPVVAFRGGSVTEIIDEGVTGFVCDDLHEAVAAVQRTAELSRARCRAVFEERFSVTRMARDYVRIYERLAEGGAVDGRSHSGPGTVLHSGVVAPRG